MLFRVVYGIAFVLTTIEGSEHGVYFQIKENSFLVSARKVLFGLEKLTLCSPALFLVGGKLLADEQTF